MISPTEKLLWNYTEAAHALCLTEQALRDLVFKGGGPQMTRLGRRVMFRPSDVAEWVDTMASASQA